MKPAIRRGLCALVVAVFTATLFSPQAQVVVAAADAASVASGPVWSQQSTDATDRVMVMYRGAPEGAQAGPITAARLAGLRVVGSRVGVWLDYSRTMGIGAYVLTLGRIVSGTELDAIVAALRQSDPTIKWVEADFPVTLSQETLVNDPAVSLQWNLKDGPGGIRALDAWDEQWQFAASEGRPGYVPDNGTGARLVRYGAYNGSWEYKEISGDFTCSPSTFGRDPNPGIVKRCEVASYWVKAADEGQPFTLARGVSKWVRYGWGDNWRYAKINDHGVCSPADFGGDPARFVTKICQIEMRTDGGGVVADEGGTFTLEFPSTVRYGVMAKWVYKQVTAGVKATCGPSYFGRDPAPGNVKHCEVVKSIGSGITIAVPDRGRVSHPDLDNKLVPGYNFFDRNADNRDLGSDTDACGHRQDPGNWHGLNVASIAGAETNNGIGIAGVAPQANILMEKVLGCGLEGAKTSNVVDAIVWAAGESLPGIPVNANPAKVMNLSMTGPIEPCGSAWQTGIDEVRASGAVVIVAAGNEPLDLAAMPRSPTNCEGVVVVAATDEAGRILPSSGTGRPVAVSAPGVRVPVLGNDGLMAPRNSTIALTGPATSYAVPHVSGVAALMMGKNPLLTPDNVEARLRLSARPFPQPCPGCGAGLLDAVMALRSAEAITTETELNDTQWTADYISAPADVDGKFDGNRHPDVFSVDVLPGSTLRGMLTTEASSASCYVELDEYPHSFGCDALMAGYQNTTATTQRLFFTVATSATESVGREYTLFADWDEPQFVPASS